MGSRHSYSEGMYVRMDSQMMENEKEFVRVGCLVSERWDRVKEVQKGSTKKSVAGDRCRNKT